MTREMRLRSAGILFYIVLLVTLLLTKDGMQFTSDILNDWPQTRVAGTLVAVAAFGMTIFTSDAIGWVLSAITICFLPIFYGHKPSRYFYANEWRKVTYHLEQEIIRNYDRGCESQNSDKSTRLDELWKKYSADVFLSYFWQQQPKALVEWVSRRYTALFIYASSAVGIFLGLLPSIVLTVIAVVAGRGFTWCWVITAIISGAVMVFLGLTSAAPRTEAHQMVDLWLRAAFDDRMREALGGVQDRFSKTGGGRDSRKD